jgi:hypothetical protein
MYITVHSVHKSDNKGDTNYRLNLTEHNFFKAS